MYKLKHTGENMPLSGRIWTVIVLLSLPLLVFLTSLGWNSTNGKKVYDGTVRYRYEDKMPDKHGDIYRIDRKLIVYFDKIKDTKEINVTPETYFQVKIGERVSFKMTYSEMGLSSTFAEVYTFICLFLIIVDIIASVIFIIALGSHFYENYKWVKCKSIKIRKQLDPYGEEDWEK